MRAAGVDPLWADEFADIPAAPSLIVANEFFDCLPIHQYQRIKTGWRERLVGLNDKQTQLEFVLGRTPPEATLGLPPASNNKEGDIAEISFASAQFNGGALQTPHR